MTANYRCKKSETPGETFEAVCARHSFLKSSLAGCRAGAVPASDQGLGYRARQGEAASSDAYRYDPKR